MGRPPEALVGQHHQVFEGHAGPAPLERGYFGFSIAPDTNINAASDAEFIYIQGSALPPGRSTGRASSDIGIVGWGGGEYQYPLAERWRLRTGHQHQPPGVQREPVGPDVRRRAYVGPRWLINRTTEMSLLATASQRWWGGSSLNYDYGARLEVGHRVFAGLRLNGRAAVERPQIPAAEVGLEGPLMVFSLGATYVPLPDSCRSTPWWAIQQQEAKVHRLEQCRVLDAGGHERGIAVGLYRGRSSAEFRWTNFEGNWLGDSHT